MAVTPITVAVASPAEGTTVVGLVPLTATVTGPVRLVQFTVDGVQVGKTLQRAPYQITWDSRTVATGTHTIQAIAHDRAKRVATATRHVTVSAVPLPPPPPDTTAPTVILTAPLANATLYAGAIGLSAYARDNIGVASVRYTVDGILVGTAQTVAPYWVVWTATAGMHTISVTARDAADNTATAAMTVTVLPVILIDTTPPVVTITAPQLDQTVHGQVVLTATASDNSDVAGVQWYINNVAFGAELVQAPYTRTWDTTLLDDGLYTLGVIARDAGGNTSNATRTITTQQIPIPPAGDLEAPVVTIVSPAGSTVSGTVTVTATATDNVGVVGVQLAVNGSPLGTELIAAPYTRTWVPAISGGYVITAVARDAAGNTTTASHSVTVSSGVAGSLLTRADITYVGAIRMPATVVDTSSAYGGLTGRQVAGVTHFFLYGSLTSDPTTAFPIYEIADPGSGYTTDYTVAPRATLVTNWGVPYGTKRHTWDNAGVAIPPASNVFFPAGIYWNETTSLLYWAYYDSYPSNHPPEWGLGATALTNPVGPVTTAYGPWRTESVDGDGTHWYGPQNGAYFMAHPTTGKLLCGGTSRSINPQVPWGPQVWGSIDWPTAATPGGFGNPNLTLADRYLYYYFMGSIATPHYFLSDGTPHAGVIRSFRLTNTPLTNIFEGDYEGPPILSADPTKTGVATWTDEQDGIGGMVWLELTHKRGVIFVGTLVGGYSLNPVDAINTAHNWYRNTGVGHELCRHGHTAPLAVTGPVSTKKVPVMLIYSPDKLAQVRAGTAVDYEQDADSIIDLELTYGIKTAALNQLSAKSVSGCYWDATRNYLFLLASHADNTRAGDAFLESLIHVFHINDA